MTLKRGGENENIIIAKNARDVKQIIKTLAIKEIKIG